MIREDQYAGLVMSHKSLQNQFAEMKKRAETAETRAGSRWNQYESERQSHAFSSRTGNHALELLKRWIEWARAHGHENGILDDSREFMKRASFPLDTQSMPSEMRETHIEVFAQEGDPSFIYEDTGLPPTGNIFWTTLANIWGAITVTFDGRLALVLLSHRK